MAIIVACACGERFGAHDGRAGQKIACPACGGEVEVPSQAPSALLSQRFLTSAAGPEGPASAAFERLPVCRKCAGSGVCPVCRGKGKSYLRESVLGGLKTLLTIYLFGFLGRYGWDSVSGQDNRAATARCVSCNGNGKCYTCRGQGRMENGGD